MNNIELTMDTNYAPDLCQEEDFLGMEQDEVKFIIVKYLINDDFSIALLEHTDQNINDIHKMIDEGIQITILGFGAAAHTSIAELMYGLNHPTRALFRSGVNDIVQKFKEGDELLRKSLKEQD
jgi:hypothetical protein